jgi:hypothetical protein
MGVDVEQSGPWIMAIKDRVTGDARLAADSDRNSDLASI